jgi:hypothetical protein
MYVFEKVASLKVASRRRTFGNILSWNSDVVETIVDVVEAVVEVAVIIGGMIYDAATAVWEIAKDIASGTLDYLVAGFE